MANVFLVIFIDRQVAPYMKIEELARAHGEGVGAFRPPCFQPTKHRVKQQ